MAETVWIVDGAGTPPKVLADHPSAVSRVFRAGAEALEALALEGADLLLVNEAMDDISGEELMRGARACSPQVPVAVMVRLENMDRIMKTFGAETLGFVPAPLSGVALEVVLERARRWRKSQGWQGLADMLASMAHELRGALAGYDGWMYQLQSGLLRGDHQRIAAAVETAGSGNHLVKGLILDILEFTAADHLRIREVAWSRLVRSAVNSAAEEAKRFGVTVTAAVSRDLGSAWVDSLRMQTALGRLLAAEIEDCRQGRDGRHPAIEVSLGSQGGSRLLVEIRTPLNPGARPSPVETADAVPGRCLGKLGRLVARHIIERHGGRIQLEETPRNGLVRILEVPRGGPCAAGGGTVQGTEWA